MQVMERPGVRRETNGPVTTIILDRPERRNAVDPPTAEALRAAFRAFDRDRTARVAVLWGAGGTVRLPAIVGFGRALDLILTGRPVDAREAEHIGLANRVVAKGKAREEAQALALGIAAFPPHSVKSDRQSAYDALGVRLGAALRHEHALGMRSAATGESLQGASRFAAGGGAPGRLPWWCGGRGAARGAPRPRAAGGGRKG